MRPELSQTSQKCWLLETVSRYSCTRIFLYKQTGRTNAYCTQKPLLNSDHGPLHQAGQNRPPRWYYLLRGRKTFRQPLGIIIRPPLHLIAYNGSQSTSKFFQDVCKIFNLHNSFTSTYHPQTNVQVERLNRKILSAIRTYILDHSHDWDLYSSALKYEYNCRSQNSTTIAQLDLFLSNHPGPLAMQKQR